MHILWPAELIWLPHFRPYMKHLSFNIWLFPLNKCLPVLSILLGMMVSLPSLWLDNILSCVLTSCQASRLIYCLVNEHQAFTLVFSIFFLQCSVQLTYNSHHLSWTRGHRYPYLQPIISKWVQPGFLPEITLPVLAGIGQCCRQFSCPVWQTMSVRVTDISFKNLFLQCADRIPGMCIKLS